MSDTHHLDYSPQAATNQMLAEMAGDLDRHIQQIEAHLGVLIRARGGRFHISGPQTATREAQQALSALYERAQQGQAITPEFVQQRLQFARLENEDGGQASLALDTRKGEIRARGPRQCAYLEAILAQDLVFGIGPAGTGKTYLAVAAAVDHLTREAVRRIVLVRPAVEAGERLGFLPGSLEEKIDPYLRPLYDALYEMLGFEKVAKLLERQVIEVAPLAYMRGRTLNDAFVILDEAQNTTPEQMKMFLTRIGFGSKAVVTGDVTQVDLPRGQLSGLAQIAEVLNGVAGVHFTFFEHRDVVRHPLVARILRAYQDYEERVVK